MGVRLAEDKKKRVEEKNKNRGTGRKTDQKEERKREERKIEIKQLGKAYFNSSVGEKPKKRGTPCHELAEMMPRTGVVRISPKITSYKRKGHTTRFCSSRIPRKREPSRTAHGNTVMAAKLSGSQDFPVLTGKISVPVVATTNVTELLTTWVKIGHQKIRGIIVFGAQISVIREEFTRDVKYEGNGLIEIVSTFREKEEAPLRIFEVSIEDGAERYVTVPCAVSKKLASDKLLSTAAYEALRENEQVYGHESHSDDETVLFASEEETEDPSVSTKALVELSIESVAPDAKSGLDTEEQRRQMIKEFKFLAGVMEHTHLVKDLDYALLQKVYNENNCKEKKEEELESLFLKHKDKGKGEEIQFKTILEQLEQF
ncbi:transposon Ty3-I Gag-Pol polyprotein [Nephila pilipes]|uniref:Transposon Ty3-I Gag-Pol polyprotein n=1 Tax=Nephila pilipes TaxID=299642 RepID=A0A8X6MGG5_NEPPI|nr:transposon Ty3-I Gag-Pol polyprotein [Nephila pilipes]